MKSGLIVSLLSALFVFVGVIGNAGSLSNLLNQSQDKFNNARSQNDREREAIANKPKTPTSNSSNHRCITVSGGCTGLDCVIDDISISGGPGSVDNSWPNPSICTVLGKIEGNYQYVLKTNFRRVCTGEFQVTSRAVSGVTISIYDNNCEISYVSEW